MAVRDRDRVTKHEVENGMEFKLIKRILKSEYDWVIDVITPNDYNDYINKYYIIFLKVVIDPFILQREVGIPLERFIIRNLKTGGAKWPGRRFYHPYIYFTPHIHDIFTSHKDEMSKLDNDVVRTIEGVRPSPAIPDELKNNKNRNFSLGGYLIPQMDIPSHDVFN